MLQRTVYLQAQHLFDYQSKVIFSCYVFKSLKAVVLPPLTALVPTTQNVAMKVAVCSVSVRPGIILLLSPLPVNEVCYWCGLNSLQKVGILKQLNIV